ncbi:MAG: FKBP-type peptidyl-prolyl cis-trans isomerase [Acidimicrobiia bacterium]
MRRRLAAVVAAGMLAAACGAGGGPPVKVAGAYGEQPDVVFPDERPGDSLAVSTPVEGKGAKVAKGDVVVANYIGYRWGTSGSKLIASSYGAGGHPGAFPSGKLVPGLDKALDGRTVGSRVVAVIPPKDGYGEKGNPQLEVGAEDSLVFVLDLLAVYPKSATVNGRATDQADARLPQVGAAQPGQAPPVTVPRAQPPTRLETHPLIQGTGKPVRPGQLVAMQYSGVFWRDGQIFDSSWKAGQVFTTTIGTGQVVKGWDEGLVGQKVGSRLLLVVPPAWGYGPKGLKQAGIKGDDTLVFVVDILGAH